MITLSGVVVDADGAPIEGALVVAYDARLASAAAPTDGSGAWRLELGDGPWRVRVLAPDTVDARESWYGAVEPELCASPALASSSSAVDVALPRGVGLTGRLLAPGGQPLVGAEVAAWTTRVQRVDVRSAISDEGGVYRLVGLDEAESPFVLAVDAAGLPETFVGGGYDEEAAPAWSASAAAAPVQDHTVRSGVILAGTVTGPDGPVEGRLTAYIGGQIADGDVVGGVWTVSGLPPGDALVWATGDGFATTWWPSDDRPTEYASATVEGATYNDLDIVAPGPGRIVGEVWGDGDPSRASVLAYNDTGTVGVGDGVQDDGTFTLTGLHAGTYTLFVWAAELGRVDGFVEEGGVPLEIEVPPAGDALWVVADRPVAAEITGRVVDVDGAGVYGAVVTAVDVDGLAFDAVADADGAFTMLGLPAGTWSLSASYAAYCPTDADWVDVGFPASRDPAAALPVLLSPGDRFPWTAVLGPDDDHDGMDDRWELAAGLDPERDDAAEDADHDGWSNLDEYLAGTDAGAGCGCGSRSGGGGGAALGAAWALVRLRRSPRR